MPIISLEDKTPNHLSWARMLGARLFNSGEHSQGIDQSLGVHRRERRWLLGLRHNNSDVICYNCPPQWTDFASIDRVGLAIALRPYRRSHDLPGIESCRRAFTIEPQAFHLHVYLPREQPGTIVTYWVPIGDFEGPHRFFDDHCQLL